MKKSASKTIFLQKNPTYMIIQPTKLFGTFEYIHAVWVNKKWSFKKRQWNFVHFKEKREETDTACKYTEARVTISSKRVLFKAFGQIYNSEMEYRGTGPFVKNLYVQVQSVL